MVPTLYFSVVTRGKLITFGHKFLAMAQKAYVITQPGSLLHLSHGKIILSDFSLFCQKLQNIYIFSSFYVPNMQQGVSIGYIDKIISAETYSLRILQNGRISIEIVDL